MTQNDSLAAEMGVLTDSPVGGQQKKGSPTMVITTGRHLGKTPS